MRPRAAAISAAVRKFGFTPGRLPSGISQLLAKELADGARVGPPARLLHHLADEESEKPLLPAPVGGDLTRVRAENARDHRLQLGLVRDRLLLQVRAGGEAR